MSSSTPGRTAQIISKTRQSCGRRWTSMNSWKRQYCTDGDEGYYFWLRIQQDQNDPKLKARFNKIDEFSKKLENESQFFYLRIARIKPELQKRFIEYEGLAKYRHFLERIFAESRYHLSEPEEKILNLKSATSSSNWTRMTAGFLSKEERAVFTEEGKRKAHALLGDRRADEQQEKTGARQRGKGVQRCSGEERRGRRGRDQFRVREQEDRRRAPRLAPA